MQKYMRHEDLLKIPSKTFLCKISIEILGKKQAQTTITFTNQVLFGLAK